jgi:T-complex protein 1 subunit gamma
MQYMTRESQTNIEIARELDWCRVLEIEEERTQMLCKKVIGQAWPRLHRKRASLILSSIPSTPQALRRIRKSDNNRIARAVGATIENSIEDLQESDVGTGCAPFNIEKIGAENFSFLMERESPKACTILLRGPLKRYSQRDRPQSRWCDENDGCWTRWKEKMSGDTI